MFTRSSIFAVLLVTLGALPVNADPVEDWITRLESEGYEIVKTRRTWLGRFQVIALADGVQREVVISLGSGEVMRDLVTVVESTEGQAAVGPVEQSARPAPPTEKRDARNERDTDAGGDAPDKPEKPEKPEKPDKPERPEKPERPSN